MIKILSKNIYALLTVVFLSLSLAGGLFLVQREQDLREKATGCPWYAPSNQCPSDWHFNESDCVPADDPEHDNKNCCCTEQPYVAPVEGGQCTIVYNLPARCFTVTNCAGQETQAFSKDYTGTTANYDQGFCGTTENPESRQTVPDNNSHTYCASAPAGKCRQIDHHFGGKDQNGNDIGAGGVCECNPPLIAQVPTNTTVPTATNTSPPGATNTPIPTRTPTPTNTSSPPPGSTSTPIPTRTLTPTNTLTPTPSLFGTRNCDQACNTENWPCVAPLTCVRIDYVSHCRHPDCIYDSDCVCTVPSSTPTSTATPTNTSSPPPGSTSTPTATFTPTPPPGSTSTPTATYTPTPPPGSTSTPTPPPGSTSTPVIAQAEPSPTRIILPSAGIDLPSRILTILGSIVVLAGLLVLL